MEKFNAKKPLYPILGLLVSTATLVYGLVFSTLDNIMYFYIALFVLYIFIGYYKAFFVVIPLFVVMGGLFAGLTHIALHDYAKTLQAVYRALAVCFATIPGISISTTLLMRGLKQAKLPAPLVLGFMISLNFFTLLSAEMKQIREAMKTRGVSGFFNIKVFYRAFLVPLVIRIVGISDTLSVSIETRGFSTSNKNVTVYNKVKLGFKDFTFVLLFVSIMVLAVVL